MAERVKVTMVTEEMVERFINAADGTENSAFMGCGRKREIRRGLEAALNPSPPPEPEIEVSDDAAEAGRLAYAAYCNWDVSFVATNGMRDAYRAMERQRRIEESATRDGRLAARDERRVGDRRKVAR